MMYFLQNFLRSCPLTGGSRMYIPSTCMLTPSLLIGLHTSKVLLSNCLLSNKLRNCWKQASLDPQSHPLPHQCSLSRSLMAVWGSVLTIGCWTLSPSRTSFLCQGHKIWLTDWQVPGTLPAWTCGQAIGKSRSRNKTSISQHLSQDMVSMSGLWCPLGSPMPQPPSKELWTTCWMHILTPSWWSI